MKEEHQFGKIGLNFKQFSVNDLGCPLINWFGENYAEDVVHGLNFVVGETVFFQIVFMHSFES